MNRTGRPIPGVLFLSAMTAAVLVSTWAMPRPASGQEVDLLKVAPFDRITLADGATLDVEPLIPRPLPPYDPKQDRPRKEVGKDGKEKPPAEGNILLPGQEPAKKPGAGEEQINELVIHTLGGDVRDFKLRRADLRQVEYFDDMLLAEADRLVRAREYDRAFEHLLRARLRDPIWRGLDESVNRLLFEEGSAALSGGDADRGLRLLGELQARKADYPGLADKLADSYGGRINSAFDLGAYARGRQVLHELERLLPDHPATRRARDRFLDRARSLVESAKDSGEGDRVDALAEALRTWPGSTEAARLYPPAFEAMPTLDVAVTDIPGRIVPWVRSPADARIARLLYLPVLADDSEAALEGRMPGQLADRVEKRDLGLRFRVEVRDGLSWSDGSRAVGAVDIARMLTNRLDPASPAFEARWADLIASVTPLESGQLEVVLARTPMKPEGWMLDLVGPAHASADGWVTTADGHRPVGSGPFRWAGSDPGEVRLESAGESGSEVRSPAIRRVRERRYPSAEAALAALIRGDVSMLDRVPPDRVAALAGDPNIEVGRYQGVSVHVIALDGRTPALRNRSLRRGLIDAIDRKTLLEETLLRRPADAANALADGPFPKGSYADASGVAPLTYDPLLARMLVAAARRELGGDPIRLRFAYPATAEARAVAPKLIEAWRLVGLEVDPVERPESDLERSLRSGERFDLAYRATRPDEPAWDAGPMLCPGYDAPPSADALNAIASPRIRQLLLELERAPDLVAGTGLVVTIDRESRDELPILPLWQLQDHYAWRSRLTGPGESARNLYDGSEGWEIEPWFAKDPW